MEEDWENCSALLDIHESVFKENCSSCRIRKLGL